MNLPLDTSYDVLLARSGKSIHKHTKEVELAISGVSNIWINDVPLYEVAIRLLALIRLDTNALNGERIALLTLRLVKDETQPGGPYRSSPYNKYITNFAISTLLSSINIGLEPLENYLETSPIGKTSQIEANVLDSIVKHSHALAANLKPQTHSPPRARVIKRARSMLLLNDSAIDYLTGRMIEKVSEVDASGEVSLLALNFYRSLLKSSPKITDKLLLELGAANYCAWIAYAIYDDFIDDEGKVELLPIANIAHRHSVLEYDRISSELEISPDIYAALFDSVDIGSLRELKGYKAKIRDGNIDISVIPDYSNYSFLSERAKGYLIGPLIVAEHLKFSEAQKSLLQQGLSEFLQARQLSDDLMDWRTDLQSGRITSVVSLLLQKADVKPGLYPLSDLTSKLASTMWSSELLNTNRLILRKLASAKRRFNASKLFSKQNIFVDAYIQPLSLNANLLTKDHGLKRAFIKTYSGE